MTIKTILALDTSCDETAAAVTWERKVLSNVIWSQIEIHQPWGGVVPDLARTTHKKYIDQVIETALKRGKTGFQKIDALAVTQGPGLSIALEVGIKKAKELAKKYKKPLIAVNHMEGHLLSSFCLNSKGRGPFSQKKPEFPLLGLLISGGHTQLVLMKDFNDCQLLGETLDDAAGEAFDKVAKMMNLGYPGGPIIEELARKGNENAFSLPIPMVQDPGLNFSFSGLKTACLYRLKEIPEKKKDKKLYQDFSASFQKALAKSITIKLKRAIEKYEPKQVILGGGVINNLYLRKEIRKTVKKKNLPLFIPFSKNLFTDNAAMIGVAAWFNAKAGKIVKNASQLDREPNLNFQK